MQAIEGIERKSLNKKSKVSNFLEHDCENS